MSPVRLRALGCMCCWFCRGESCGSPSLCSWLWICSLLALAGFPFGTFLTFSDAKSSLDCVCNLDANVIDLGDKELVREVEEVVTWVRCPEALSWDKTRLSVCVSTRFCILRLMTVRG